jgi:serine/threonine protein kinase
MPGHHRGLDLERGEPVYVRAVAGLSPEDVDDLGRARHAIDVGRTAALADCSTIARLIDYADERVETYGYGDPYEVVHSAWEWGDRVLLDELCDGQYDSQSLAASVGESIGAAIECLHAVGLVHSDVAPNNIVCVRGTWKLADFDHTVREGERVTGVPKRAYLLEGVAVGTPARREADDYALSVVLDRIRSRAHARSSGSSR